MSTRRIISSYISCGAERRKINWSSSDSQWWSVASLRNIDLFSTFKTRNNRIFIADRRTRTCWTPTIRLILFEENETCFYIYADDVKFDWATTMVGQWETFFLLHLFNKKIIQFHSSSIMSAVSLFWFSFYSVLCSVAHLIVCLFLFCEPFFLATNNVSKQIILTCLFQCSNCLVRTIKQT